NVALTLVTQLLAVRDVLMADRYVYLPCIGAFLVGAYGLGRWTDSRPALRMPAWSLVGASVLALALATHARARVWHDSASVFSDVIEKGVAERGRFNPFLSLAYNNRGVARKVGGDLDGALADYNEAARINPRDTRSYVNRDN